MARYKAVIASALLSPCLVLADSASTRQLSGVEDEASILGMVFGDCSCSGIMDCDTDSPGTSVLPAPLDLIISFILMLYAFKALGSMCDDYFVIALEAISEALELSPDVAGATFMAAGSSAPELFTSIVATFLIVNEGGVGTIIGSAIFNILVIIGATCLFAGQSLKICWYPLTRDTIFYVIAISEMSLVLLDEEIVIWEALLMVFSYVLYCVFMKYSEAIALKVGARNGDVEVIAIGAVDTVDTGKQATVEDDKKESEDIEEAPPSSSPAADGGTGGPDSPPAAELPNVATEETTTQRPRGLSVDSLVSSQRRHSASGSLDGYHPHRRVSYQYGVNKFRAKSHTIIDIHHQVYAPAPGPTEGAEPTIVEAEGKIEEEEKEELKGWRKWVRDPLVILWEYTMPGPSRYWILFSLSILWIGALTYLMVDACNRIGCILNLPALVMGLVFLAAGTSVPDALGSIAVAKQGEGDMAVSNAIGSNVFDIMLGLGVPWTLKLAMGKKVLFTGATSTLPQYILILTVVLLLFLATVKLNKWILSKRMGASLLTIYGAYVVYALVRGGSE
ncbi:hypothetical protein FOL47_001247 [Perkinsus chesapeaki]|uniref:Sodium/calcium exchanger membrane region domain-containing protein n=1 Tax=Perkinsus chesapeaki TaxID=330153 RepID=A0A7J6MJH2_PERCH|nr:hypothetical protein FOL47_001247 [Perkinsus chesapeaki]